MILEIRRGSIIHMKCFVFACPRQIEGGGRIEPRLFLYRLCKVSRLKVGFIRPHSLSVSLFLSLPFFCDVGENLFVLKHGKK